MLNIFYITYPGKLLLHSRAGVKELQAADIKILSERRMCLFADLGDTGVIILHYLHEWGLKPDYFGVNLDITYIRVGGASIKNSSLFGIDLSGDFSSVSKNILDLKLFVMECLGKTIYDREINSLASISALLLKREGVSCYYKPKDLSCVLRAGYFGGRKQSFSISGEETRCYDFPSMYGTIQCEPYPAGLELKTSPVSINRPGFHLVEFRYEGIGLAPRLPIRDAKGSVNYVTSGEGWFWYEELQAFEYCGGKIVALRASIEAEGMQEYLKKINLYLLAKKNLGNKIAKGVANRIYGRLAINPNIKVTRYKKLEGPIVWHNMQYKSYKRFADSIIYEEEGQKEGAKGGNIAWASIITSRGRAKLMRLMYECELLGFCLIRVNTDSVEIKSDLDVKINGLLFCKKAN